MRTRWLVTGAVLPCLFGLALPVWGQESVKLFPESEIKPGLKGVGRTVFEGNKVEEFQVEFLGVLKNAIAPKHDVILARLSGGPLEKTGVVMGMSGSPVYVDGKLVGAVALSFPFSKDAVAGITPIEEMLDVVPEPRAESKARANAGLTLRIARASTGSPDSGRLIPDGESAVGDLTKLLPPEEATNSLSGLPLPLRFGGFSSQAIQDAGPLLRRMGFQTLQGRELAGGSAPAAEFSHPDATNLEPGRMISVLLVRGDLDLNVDCTITYRQGDNLYACGHRFLLTGPVQFPFATANVLTTVSSLASSFKVDTPGELAGSIRQDRFGAIYGVVGDKTRLIPVRLQVDSTLNKKEDYQFEMVQETFLSPLLLNLAVVSTLSATERFVGPSTLELKGKLRFSGGESVDLEDVLSGDLNTPALVGSTVATPLAYVLSADFPDLRVEGLDLSIDVKNEKRLATLEQVWSTKSEVHPGDRIEVIALLRSPGGESVTERIPVDVPDSVNDKTLSLVVGSGASINALQAHLSPMSSAPRDLHQLVRALNRMRRNNRVYALLMSPQRSFVLHGDEYPSPPPSLIQTFLADPAVSSNVIFTGSSVVGDFETKPCPFAVRGQKTLILKVGSVGFQSGAEKFLGAP